MVARSRLDVAALALARRLARLDPALVVAARRCVRAAHDLPLAEGVALERRLGIPFVERYDVSGSLADAQRLTALAREGRVLVFFPEGTFTRRAGLSAFREANSFKR